jgi:hypothetical protein
MSDGEAKYRFFGAFVQKNARNDPERSRAQGLAERPCNEYHAPIGGAPFGGVCREVAMRKHKFKRLLIVGSLVLALLGAGAVCCTCVAIAPRPNQAPFCYPSKPPEPRELVVQLRCAKIPWLSAVHCWFAEFDTENGTWHRWEVWQTAGPFGHIRKNFMAADSDVGDGPSWALAEWRGPEAERLHAVLYAPEKYPYPWTYRYWPGPNSNTYVAWVLEQAEVPYKLPFGAIGKDY